jgi:hypothetical protein
MVLGSLLILDAELLKLFVPGSFAVDTDARVSGQLSPRPVCQEVKNRQCLGEFAYFGDGFPPGRGQAPRACPTPQVDPRPHPGLSGRVLHRDITCLIVSNY